MALAHDPQSHDASRHGNRTGPATLALLLFFFEEQGFGFEGRGGPVVAGWEGIDAELTKVFQLVPAAAEVVFSLFWHEMVSLDKASGSW